MTHGIARFIARGIFPLPMLADSPIPIPSGLVAELRAAYAEPARAYHSFDHVEEVLRHWGEVARAVGWRRPSESYVAVLFHDAIYVAGARENEAASASFACDAANRYRLAVDSARVAELIRLTARHGTLAPPDVDEEARVFLDCDMAILGSAPDRFARYEAQIAEEYAGVPPDAYRLGRIAFLERLSASERIFLSDFWHSRLERSARDNIGAALVRMRSSLPRAK